MMPFRSVPFRSNRKYVSWCFKSWTSVATVLQFFSEAYSKKLSFD